MSLTDTQVRSAKPQAKEYTLRDGRNLFLRVATDGARYWIFRYQYAAKQKQMSLGRYPGVTLQEARDEADRCRKWLRDGKDPQVCREVERARTVFHTQNTFATIAAEFLDHFTLQPGEVNDQKWTVLNRRRHEGLLRLILLPGLGAYPIAEITPAMVLAVLKIAQEERGIPTAHQAQTTCKMVFAYAIAHQKGILINPARDLKAALKSCPTAQHHAALKFDQVGPFLRALAVSEVAPITQLAIRLQMMLALRDTSLRKIQWRNVDLEGGFLFSPASNNKGKVAKRRDFETPLPRQAVALLQQLRQLTEDGPDSFLFAGSGKTGYLSQGTIAHAIRGCGFNATGHGMRSLMRAWAAEHSYAREVAKTQLMQVVGDAVDQAYLHTTDFFEQRAAMLQAYADNIEAAEKNLEPALPVNVRRLRRAA